MKTIAAISAEVGVSKVAVTKHIERNGFKDRLVKDANRYLVPDDIYAEIKRYFDRRATKTSNVGDYAKKAENNLTDEILALLREQLASKDAEIERLHKQVDDLQKINLDMVKAVRELNTLQAMQLTDGISTETDNEPRANPEKNDIKASDEQPKKSFFKWIRRK